MPASDPKKPGPARGRTGAQIPAAGRPATGTYPESVVRLIEEFAKLPGVGRRSAERLAFHVLKAPKKDALPLATAIRDVKERVHPCRVCFNLCDESGPGAPGGPAEPAALCSVCADDRRDRSVVMIVEQPKDLVTLEQTGAYKGIYHVLMGRLSPLEGVGAGDLTISGLVERVRNPGANAGGVPVAEVVLGLNPTLEGDATALFVSEALAKIRGVSPQPVKITRLARGVPTGTQLEYASPAVLADAIEGRKPV